MSIEQKRIEEAVEKAKLSAKRRFSQSLDLLVTLKGVDIKKSAGKLGDIFELPNPPGTDVNVCVIGSGQMILEAKKFGVETLQREELEALGKDKKTARKLAKKFDFFVSEAPLMPTVGKTLGSFLGPRGKMPTPIAPNTPIGPVIERHKRLVRIRVKDQPVIQCRVGTEDMSSPRVAENVSYVITRFAEKLDQGIKNMRAIYVKTTMGSPVNIALGEKRK